MTTTEIAREIRKELKAEGIKANVKKKGETEVYVYLKDKFLQDKYTKNKVVEIAEKYEEIYRDNETGELLEGLNKFVFVR